MKKLILLTVALIFTGIATSVGQDNETNPKKMKTDQSDVYNDFYISIGTGTVFYFIENNNMGANSMSGTFLAGFCRSINKVIAVGFQVSYTKIDRSQTDQDYQSPASNTNYQIDNLWQGLANVRFRYLNKPAFCMYSGIGIGVTMDYYYKSNNYNSTTSKGQKLLPAAQLTLLGFRVGRALSLFGEFGIGTNSILNAGISYKFGE